ncbi:MAG: Unknown protein [uncultured Sulfurovum sp.]|uniref:DNA helicase n=1 Tax=uncultured Sulfurovum sp. TaxID=269237 RepID=A0A6S6S9P7_9BACT|nr:MAG: Unknown protein [uncultured Sulfurovum sp.]
MSERKIDLLIDTETEQALLHSLMSFDTDETMSVLLKAQEKLFYDKEHQTIFGVVKKIEDLPNVKLSLETVMAELRAYNASAIPSLMNIATSEPTPSPAHAFAILDEWYRKRKVYYALKNGLDALFEGEESSLVVGNQISKELDDAIIINNDTFTSFADLRVQFANATPLAKISTGIPFLDAKMKGGLEDGQFVLLFGDPEAGKTMLGTQIMRNMSKNWKTMFFPFEFSSRSFFEHSKDRYKGQFNEDNLYVEDGSADLFDIESKLKMFAKRGGKIALIDSQSMVENHSNKGTSEERETEKFHVLSRVCLRYGLRIIFICQQAKEDTRSGIVSPMKSKMGGHYAHQIYKVEMPKKKYDNDGNLVNFTERDLVVYKNKQTGLFGKKPIHFDKKTLEFTGMSKPKEDGYKIIIEEDDKDNNVYMPHMGD